MWQNESSLLWRGCDPSRYILRAHKLHLSDKRAMFWKKQKLDHVSREIWTVFAHKHVLMKNTVFWKCGSDETWSMPLGIALPITFLVGSTCPCLSLGERFGFYRWHFYAMCRSNDCYRVYSRRRWREDIQDIYMWVRTAEGRPSGQYINNSQKAEYGYNADRLLSRAASQPNWCSTYSFPFLSYT